MKKNICLVLLLATPILAGCNTSSPAITEISIKGNYQTEFAKGEALNTDGIIVKAKYENGEEKEITGWTVTGFNSNQYGPCEVTINYENFTAKYTVDIDLVKSTVPDTFGGNVHDYTYRYKDSYFATPGTNVNKELALLSYGLAHHNGSIENMTKIFNKIEFSNQSYHQYGEGGDTPDSAAYALAHKTINNEDVVALSIRGFNYGREWAGNFNVGITGNHNGFQEASESVYQGLKIYLQDNNYTNPKIWITGYSRAGAIANFVASYINEDDELNIAEDNLYAYTFEAPRGLTEQNAKNYANVHNFINSCDIIAKVLPEEYGLYRAGHDIDIYSSTAETTTFVNDFIPDFLPEFVPVTSAQVVDDASLVNALFTALLASDNAVPLDTREHLYNNYQDHLMYLLNIVFSLKQSTLNSIIADIKGKEMEAILPIIASKEALYGYVKPFLDDDGVEYDEDIMLECAEKIMNIRDIAFSKLLLLIMGGPSNMLRAIKMHCHEVNYALLKAYVEDINIR